MAWHASNVGTPLLLARVQREWLGLTASMIPVQPRLCSSRRDAPVWSPTPPPPFHLHFPRAPFPSLWSSDSPWRDGRPGFQPHSKTPPAAASTETELPSPNNAPSSNTASASTPSRRMRATRAEKHSAARRTSLCGIALQALRGRRNSGVGQIRL